MPYFDHTHNQWVGVYETRNDEGEVSRRTEWFDDISQALDFGKTGQMPFVEVGEMQPDGVVGGDGAGEAHSRRWRRQRPDGDWDVVTVYGYAFDQAERSSDWKGEPLWSPEVMIEHIVCTDPEDPGSTEHNSDYRYESWISGFPTEEQAKQVALVWVRANPTPKDA